MALYIRCSLRVFHPQMALASQVVEKAFDEENLDCHMTSAYRVSGEGSLHPFGYAADYDAPRELTPSTWESIRRTVRDRLGPEFDVLAHDAGSGMHLHVEYDPREKPGAVRT